MASSQIMAQSVELMKNSSCSSSCPPGFEDQPPPAKVKQPTNSITEGGDGEENNHNTSIVDDEDDVFESQTSDSKLTDSTTNNKFQFRNYQPHHPLNTPYYQPVQHPGQYLHPFIHAPAHTYMPPPPQQFRHVGDTYLTARPTESFNYLVPSSSFPGDFQDPYSRNDIGQFYDYNYINDFTTMKSSEKKAPSPENKIMYGFQKNKREMPEKFNNSRLSTNSDSLYSPRSISSNVRPTSQGSERSRSSGTSPFKSYRISPRYNKQYSEQNLYIAGFNTDYNFDQLKSDIIKVINDFGNGIEITEADFSVQVKESNKDPLLLEVAKRPSIDRNSLLTKFSRLTVELQNDENESDTECEEAEKKSPPRTPSKNYAFLDFESKELANQVLELLSGRDHLYRDQRQTIESIFGESFNCKKAKKQNQDTTNVFFKGQPENFRNEEEYQNPENAKSSSPASIPKIHSYNEHEIVLIAIHSYLLSADEDKVKNSCSFDNAEWFGENELKKVVSLRIQSDSKTKANDKYPGLICLIRYKYEEDAKEIINIFGGTEDEKDALNKPKKFLEAKPYRTSNLCCLSDLPAEPLITIINKLKKVDWPKFGDNLESGKKVSNVGERAWEKAIQFCKDEKYKQIVGDSDLMEVKHANTAQEKAAITRKSPEKYDESMMNGDTFSPSSSYSRSGSYPSNNYNFDSFSTPKNYSQHRRYSYKDSRDRYSQRDYRSVKYDYSSKTCKTPGRANKDNWRNVKPSPSETIPTTNSSPSPRLHNSEFKANVRSEVPIEKSERGSGTSKLNAFRNKRDKELNSESHSKSDQSKC